MAGFHAASGWARHEDSLSEFLQVTLPKSKAQGQEVNLQAQEKLAADLGGLISSLPSHSFQLGGLVQTMCGLPAWSSYLYTINSHLPPTATTQSHGQIHGRPSTRAELHRAREEQG